MATEAATDGAKAPRNVMLSDRTHDALKRMAWEKRLSISEVVRDALHSYKPLREYLDEGGVR